MKDFLPFTVYIIACSAPDCKPFLHEYCAKNAKEFCAVCLTRSIFHVIMYYRAGE
nr:MAG TPA: hypothetical protein [Caudoviricetes sp.]